MKKYVFLYLMLCVMACKKHSDSPGDTGNPPPPTVTYSGNLMKSTDNVVTSATGTVSGSFNPANNELSFTFTWQGLTSKAIEMHIHDAGPIIIPIEGFPMATSGTYSGKATLTAAQVGDLQAGKLYGQIHTENYPAGEVIGTFTTGSNNNGGNNGGGNNGGGNPPY